MKRTKLDRWERLLERNNGDEDDWRAKLIPAERVLKLLRREHRAVVRMVQAVHLKYARVFSGTDAICMELIARLNARAR